MIRLACSLVVPSWGGAGGAAFAGDAVGAIDSSVNHLPLVHLGEHATQHPNQRLPGRERLHHAAAALELAIGSFLHVVGAEAPVMGIREVGAGKDLGLGFLRKSGCLVADAHGLLACQVVQLAHKVWASLGEGGMEDGERYPFPLVRRCQGNEVRDAALSRCHAVPVKTSSMARRSSSWESDMMQRAPSTPRSRSDLKKERQSIWDSVSMVSRPRSRR